MADLPQASTPPPNISSTPIHSDNAIFSDELLASSPPSSPPEFPWDDAGTTKQVTPSKPLKPTFSAFSILGKRKALASTNDNARLAKRATPATTVKKQNDKPLLTQMQISLGQEVQKKCKACGMEYIVSSIEDRRLHDKYHAQNLQGYDVGKEFLSKSRPGHVFNITPAKKEGNDQIAAVDAFDSVWRRKRARAALDVVQRELGAVEIPDAQLWDNNKTEESSSQSGMGRYTTYMYVRQSKCIGFLLVEQISEARRVLEPASTEPVKIKTKTETQQAPIPTPASSKAKPSSALERLRARRALQEQESQDQPEPEAEAEAEPSPDQPIQLASNPTTAKLGISRIWTSPSHRGQGIAKALLDCAVRHYNERVDSHNRLHVGNSAGRQSSQPSTESEPAVAVPSQQLEPKHALLTKATVAFSQPTEAGAKLARKWSGKKYGWLVYVD